MARPLRIEFPFAVYHITSRGNAKQHIFLDDHDRRDFLRILNVVTKRFNWVHYAYCLMNNHYHLVTETPDANLSKGMRQLNGEYAQLFNWWHKRIGHVFQGRYKAILVEKETYLLEVCRYVVLNPVRARFVLTPQDWRWSSYHATVGNARSIENLAVGQLLKRFSTHNDQACRAYVEFVHDGIGQDSLWDAVKGQLVLGGAEYVRSIRKELKNKKEVSEIPKIQRYVDRPSLEEMFGKGKYGNAHIIRDDIMKAYHYGYTMREIAERLGIHYSTVSRMIRRAEKNV
ncbi:hypothetical protein AMJ87_13975 [candidate division WOR_3 bacterium SM23_60]|uniref:Transposase IS200-like domain-containing protein n=1 Tax=candidate division WOR_3 bacterium SM23_60 TaxID=1703780 RepID=A0A0S8G3E0_UNCW3|nr:MAG: hypothetical protein AMJ87_13975 [candidate division WOR_3 bacterium SM23_60]